MNKIIKDLSQIKSRKNKTIGLCHGVFDLIHLGHINHFKEAKKKCDILVVSITADKFIKKGPHQPYFSHLDRANFLLELKSIDFVIISNQPTAESVLNKIKPQLEENSILIFNQFYNFPGWSSGEYRAFSETFDENEYDYLAFGLRTTHVVVKIKNTK